MATLGRDGHCDHCGLDATERTQYQYGEFRFTDVDPCLGIIDGVAHACCGHGETKSAYVVIGGEIGQSVKEIEDYVKLKGQDALDWFVEQRELVAA